MPFTTLFRDQTPLLTGTINYLTWTHDLRILLKLSHLWQPISGVRPRPTVANTPLENLADAIENYETDLLRISAIVSMKLAPEVKIAYLDEKWDDGVLLWKDLEMRYGARAGRDCRGVLGGSNSNGERREGTEVPGRKKRVWREGGNAI